MRVVLQQCQTISKMAAKIQRQSSRSDGHLYSAVTESKMCSSQLMPRHTLSKFFICTLVTTAGLMSPRASTAQAKPFSLEDVLRLVQSGVAAERIGQLIAGDCVSFPVDGPAAVSLRERGASEEVVTVLRKTCYTGPTLIVSTDPASAEVLVNGAAIGRSPLAANLASASQALLEVRRGSWHRQVSIPLDPATTIRVYGQVPADTQPTPTVISRTALAKELGLAPPEIARPEYPTQRNRSGRYALIGVIAAGAVGYNGYQSCPNDEFGDKETGCALLWISGASVGTYFLTAGLLEWRQRSNYNRRVREYPRLLEEYEKRRAAASVRWYETDPALAAAHQRRATETELLRRKVAASNARIHADGEQLPPPRVTIEPKRP